MGSPWARVHCVGRDEGGVSVPPCDWGVGRHAGRTAHRPVLADITIG